MQAPRRRFRTTLELDQVPAFWEDQLFNGKEDTVAASFRIGDVNFASINGEVYSPIGMRLKAKAPANKTIVVTLANGRANSGYIYSDDVYSLLSFQVVGSRLQPGCAEEKIISNIVELERKSAH